MPGIFASKAVAGKPRCARCKRPFTPKHEGDRYGPRCARKMAGQTYLSALDHVDRTDAEGEPHDDPVDANRQLDDSNYTVIV